ncbi:9652_t:CDS:2, partial [Scutellospora calospora]
MEIISKQKDNLTIANTSDNSTEDTWKWMNTKLVPNNKRDIYWRLQHNALPLGYRIRHIDPNDPGNCPNCRNIVQTPEHFALSCPISQKIWKISTELVASPANLKIPNDFNSIFTDRYTGNIQWRNWINIITIYEIWYWYTQAKWGDSIPDPILELLIKHRLRKELEVLRNKITK